MRVATCGRRRPTELTRARRLRPNRRTCSEDDAAMSGLSGSKKKRLYVCTSVRALRNIHEGMCVAAEELLATCHGHASHIFADASDMPFSATSARRAIDATKTRHGFFASWSHWTSALHTLVGARVHDFADSFRSYCRTTLGRRRTWGRISCRRGGRPEPHHMRTMIVTRTSCVQGLGRPCNRRSKRGPELRERLDALSACAVAALTPTTLAR